MLENSEDKEQLVAFKTTSYSSEPRHALGGLSTSLPTKEINHLLPPQCVNNGGAAAEKRDVSLLKPSRAPPNDSPTGARMFLKTNIVKENVKTIYLEYPSTRGDDRLLIKRYLDRFCPQVRLTAKQFELLRTIPSFESIRRRGQELRVEIPSLQPTERTKQKRYRRSEAFRHYYGDGQLHVSDFTKETMEG